MVSLVSSRTSILTMNKYLLLIVCSWLPGLAWGQGVDLNNNIPVADLAGHSYPHGWAGGNNTPHYSDIDLDLDGQADLVVFNPDARTFTTYINVGDSGQVRYRYDPRYQGMFEPCRSCVDFALLVDYNCDGREDVICGRNTGANFKVYENVLHGNDSISFELRYDPLTTYFPAGDRQGFVSQVRTDLPAFADVDYDGDLDIISSQLSPLTWCWYRNYAMEDHGRCDTLDMVYEQSCWGYFRESPLDNGLIIPDTGACPRSDRTPPSGSPPLRHVGDALLVFDSNGDSLVDMLIGDVGYPTAVLAINHGTQDDAFMTEAIYRYPQTDSSINSPLLPAFYHLDVNNDGNRDLLVAPKDGSIQENVRGTSLYLNAGRDDSVDFRFQGRTFIASEQFDAGRSAAPAFVDVNADGLLDLLVGGENATWATNDTLLFTESRSIALHLFQNVGSADAPSYRLVDSNYLDLASIFPPLNRPTPAVGDLDGDGDPDLLVGTGSGKIRHFVNLASSGSPADFVPASAPELQDENGNDIGADFSYASPTLYDLDGDGDLDLFTGNRFGRIIYYENVGTSTQFSFRLITDAFGHISLDTNPTNPIDFSSNVYSHPRIIDHDQDGTPSLVVGSDWGYLEVFDGFEQGVTDSLPRTELLFDRDFGRRVVPAAAALDSTAALNWVLGTIEGGMLLLNSQPYDTTVSQPDPVAIEPPQVPSRGFRLYPNPTQGWLQVEFATEQADTPFRLTLLSPVGQALRTLEGQGRSARWDLRNVAPGLYLVRIQHRGRQWVEKVLLR